MKTSTKIIIGLLIALMGVIWYAVKMHEKANREQPKNPIVEESKKRIETEAAEIHRDVKANGIEHVVYKMIKEIDQSALDRVNADLLDTIDALNIERSKLKQVTVIASTLSIKNQKLERKISDLATTYSHSDDYATLSVNVPYDSLKPATFDLKYNADLTATQYHKRSWLFGANESYIDIYSNDPRVTIRGAKTLTVKQKEPRFSAQLKAVSEYDVGRRSFVAGPAIGIDAGRTTFQGRYLYDPSRNKWNWIISAGLNVASF